MKNIIAETRHVLEQMSIELSYQSDNISIYKTQRDSTLSGLLDYKSFKDRVFELDVSRADIRNEIKNIYDAVKKNLEMCNSIWKKSKETWSSFGLSGRVETIEEILEFIQNQPIDSVLDKPKNYDYYIYCEKIEESLRPLFQNKDNGQPANQLSEQTETALPKTATIEKPRPEKVIKPFPEYLTYGYEDHRNLVAEFLKKEFHGKKGKWIAYMLMVLKERKEVSFDINTELYKSIKLFFGEDIGTDKSINKYYQKGEYKTDQDYKEIQYSIAAFIIENHIITS
jgi:hypothetical protein